MNPSPFEDDNGKFHILKESRTLMAAFFVMKLLDTMPDADCDERSALAWEQADSLLALRRRERDRVLTECHRDAERRPR